MSCVTQRLNAFARSSGGVYSMDVLFIIIKGSHSSRPLPFDAKNAAYVLGHEPRFTVHIHDAHGAELGILENLHVVHRLPSLEAQLIRTSSMYYRTFTFAVASRAGASLMSKPSRFTLVESSL